MTNNKMQAKCTIIEVDEPITTISYDETNGYYIDEKDVYNQINSYIENSEYDHVFVCFKMLNEKELGMPDAVNWIGLGSMEYCGKGFSDIRITDDDSSWIYEYSKYNNFPEEVFLHEFLHTLERNSEEYGYEVPALHSYEIYGYDETSIKFPLPRHRLFRYELPDKVV